MVHCFDAEVAKEYGILEAVIINHFTFWLSKNKANQMNFHDGDYWTYNSTAAFQELFPYASKRQIERALQHLRDEGIIKVGNYNAVKYDRTLWYAFTEKGKCISRFGEMEIPKMGNGDHQTVTPIPDNNSDNNPYTDTNNSRGGKPRKRFNPPSVDEIKIYCQENGYSIDAEKFIDYYTSNGWMVGKNHMKDWKATVRNWARKDRDTRRKQEGEGNPFMEMLREEEAKNEQSGDFEDYVTI